MWPNTQQNYVPGPGYPNQQGVNYPNSGYPVQPPSLPQQPQGFVQTAGHPVQPPALPQQNQYPVGFQQASHYPPQQQSTPYPSQQHASPYPSQQQQASPYPPQQQQYGSNFGQFQQPSPYPPQQQPQYGANVGPPAYPASPFQQAPYPGGAGIQQPSQQQYGSTFAPAQYPPGPPQNTSIYPSVPQYPAQGGGALIGTAYGSVAPSAPVGHTTTPSAPSGHTSHTAHPSQNFTSMQQYQEIPTVRPSNQDPLADAQALRKAMKGFGTDEAAIINVLTKRTNAERLKIEQAYKQSFGKDLIKDLKSELGGRLEEVVLALMTNRWDYLAQTLRKAMAGIGTKEKSLIDVLCTATNQEIQWINAAYTRLYGTKIERDLAGDTSGHFRRLLVSMNTGGRFEGPSADPGIAVQDAQALLQAGVKKWGTDESQFNAVLATRSWPQLRLTFQEYEKLAGHSIEKAILGEFSGDVEQGMLAVVKAAKNRAAYFAERLHESIAGFGTKDDDLIFLVVTRSEVDLESVKQEYQRMYNKALAADIAGDTSGDYKKILLALVN